MGAHGRDPLARMGADGRDPLSCMGADGQGAIQELRADVVLAGLRAGRGQAPWIAYFWSQILASRWLNA